jgi:quinol monooxygenase YgiN
MRISTIATSGLCRASSARSEVATLLTGALPLAEAEPGTVDWYAARTSSTTFWIFDTFGSEDARQAHINGEIAAALTAQADELLASPPEILAADVLARRSPHNANPLSAHEAS